MELNLKHLPESQRPRILMAQGNKFYMKEVLKQARACGFDVTSASPVGLGLACLKEGHKFDIIFMAVDSWDMTGLEMLEKLSKETIEMPVVIMMANVESENKEDRFKAIDLGASDYVVTPVNENFVRNVWLKHVLKEEEEEEEYTQETEQLVRLHIAEEIEI